MKIFIPFLALIFSLNANAQSPELCKIMLAEGAAAKAKHYTTKSATQTAAYDVKYYRLNIELDPQIRAISGSVTSYFQAVDSALSTLAFDLSDSLIVDSIYYHNQSLSFNRHLTNAVQIQLPNPITVNTLDSIRIYYHGTPDPVTNPLAFSIDTVSGDTVLWTLSEPYGAQDWWPCKNSLNDKADSVEIIIRTPERYKVASIGLLKTIDTANGYVRYHYKSNYPIAAYLVAVAVAEYNYYEEYLQLGTDSLLMEYYLYPNNTFSGSSHGMEGYIKFFDSLFGEYPFIKEKYGHADFTFGGGIEHQTMSFMGNNGGELKAHELAHQWFGNKITCASWSDLWLNEGFATYLTALTYEFGVVHDPFYYSIYLNGMEGSSLNYPNGSVYRYDTSNVSDLFNGLVYSKGGFALHMLRWTIGDSAFFEGVRNYIGDPNLAFAFANTEQLKAHFESSSGQNLEEFFNDWVYGAGFPTIDSYWSQSGNQFELRVNQLQSDTSVSFFNIPLPYQLFAANWDTTIVVNPSFSGEMFTLTINRAIDSIQLDPENWVLNQEGIISGLSENKLHPQIELFPNPAANEITLKLPKELTLNRISLYNTAGRLILDQQGGSKINVSQLPNGIYFINLLTDKGSFRKKLIKY